MADQVGIFGDAGEDPTLELERELGAQDAPTGQGEPEQTPEPEPSGGDGAGTAPEPHAPRTEHPTVPLPEVQALRQEKARIAQELSEQREWRARMEERFRIAQEQAAAAEERRRQEEAARLAAQTDPEPDPVEDPDGHHAWEIRQLQRRQDAFEQGQLAFAQSQQQAQVQQRWQRLEDNVSAFETRFIARQPDYMQALNHVIANRVQFWRAAGKTDEQIWGRFQGDMSAMLQQERLQFLDACVQIGPDGSVNWIADPSERMYAFAQTLGYQAPGAQQNGAQRQVAQPQPQAQPRRVQMAQAGVAAAERQAPGGRPPEDGGPMTLEQFNALPLDEAAWWLHHRPNLMRDLMS